MRMLSMTTASSVSKAIPVPSGIAWARHLSLRQVALQIGDYSMRVDGDFVSNYRLVLMIGGSRVEARVEVTKLAGFLWDRHCTGLHAVVTQS